MAYSIFSLTGRANPNLLAEKMYRQQWKRNSFGLWVAPEFVKATRDTSDTVVPGANGEPRPTGAPIEVFRQFVKAGKTTLDIPVRVRLTAAPVYGDKALKGTEESAKVVYRTVKINITRKAYNRPTGISAQITLPWLENLITDASMYLTDWWNDYHPGNFIATQTAGASLDLLAPAAEGGRAVSIVSHPNFYGLGQGKAAYTAGRPGTSAYEATVETIVDAASVAGTHGLSVAKIQALVLEAQRLRIQPTVMRGGFRRFPIWLSDSQWMQLASDTDFKEFYRRLPNELDNHPLATGARADLFGAIIYVDQNMPGAITNANPYDAASPPTAGTVEYGVSPTAANRVKGYKFGDMINNRSTVDRKVGFLLGPGAMSVGVGIPVYGNKRGPSMQFNEEFDDYGAISSIGIATVQSVVRSDIYDQDGMTGLTAGQFYENTSGLNFVSYSPDEITI
jgi:hypothetical protein